MTFSKPSFPAKFFALAAALVLCGGALHAATARGGDEKTPAAKKIVFTTKSPEAREIVLQLIKRVESFQFGPQAQPLAQKAVEADPNFAFAHYLFAITNPPPQAKPHHDKALELAKNASEGERRYLEAMALTRAQKPAEALAAFEALAKDYPEDRMVQMMIGQVSFNTGRRDVARAAFERALQLDGSTPRVYGFLGNVHLMNGDTNKARELFKQSLARTPEGAVAFVPNYGLAFAHTYEGDVASALKALQDFEVVYSKSSGAQDFPPVFIWNSIGRLLLENGRAEESIKAYEKGYATVSGSNLSEIEKKTWLGRLHHGRGRALAKMGKHEEAWKEAELIKKMIEENGEQGKPFWPAYHYIAGYLKLEAKDYPKAVEHLKQADQNDPFQKLLLARAYERSGDQVSAQKVYREIVETPQNNIERALSYPEAKKKLKG
ncbi:MAG: tetratricopeptide repeat protein [Pyrinomonadaceae bacterium]